MPNIYETIIIFDPSKETIVKAEIRKYEEMLQKYSIRKKVKIEDLGEKRLAYEIKSHKTAWYCVFTYEASHDDTLEIERQCRIDDHVLKFITVKTEDDDYEDVGDKLDDFYPAGEQPDDVKPDASDIDLFDLIFNCDTHLTSSQDCDIISKKKGGK